MLTDYSNDSDVWIWTVYSGVGKESPCPLCHSRLMSTSEVQEPIHHTYVAPVEKCGPSAASFSFISVFSNNKTIFTRKKREKIIHLVSCEIRTLDLSIRILS